MPDIETKRDRIAGVLLGTAVGDAVGLPREALSARRAMKLFGGAPLGHRLVFGRGMVSDDTEHTCMVAQAFLASGGQAGRFARSLAWRLRFWMLGLPAGVGLGTLKGIAKLWLGFPPSVSGVKSAGNGPAMRSGLLGLLADDAEHLAALAAACTRLTHRDDRAEQGALAVAILCRYASSRSIDQISSDGVFELLLETVTNDVLRDALEKVRDAFGRGASPAEAAAEIGCTKGVSGYVVHSVPMAVFCWLRHADDFRSAVEEAILLGGDTDTTGAITGALAGATTGASGIPDEWLDGLIEWPRSVAWMNRLADRLAACKDIESQAPSRPLGLFWPGILVRNAVFLIIVLLHCLRRAMPPY